MVRDLHLHLLHWNYLAIWVQILQEKFHFVIKQKHCWYRHSCYEKSSIIISMSTCTCLCICISDKLDSHSSPIQAFMFLICQYTKTNSSVTIGVRVMMLNPTFNDILVISWRSVLLVEETRTRKNLLQVADKFYHIILYLLHSTMSEINNISGDRHWLHM
jgi:hypothetical protein